MPHITISRFEGFKHHPADAAMDRVPSTQNIFRDGTSRPCGDDPYGETVTLR